MFNHRFTERGHHTHLLVLDRLLAQGDNPENRARTPQNSLLQVAASFPVRDICSFVYLWLLLNIPMVCHRNQLAVTPWIFESFLLRV